MKLSEIKKACNEILLATFQTIPVYGNDTHDGYARPAFFTEILPRQYSRQSKSVVQEAYTYIITFLEQTHDEAVCLDIVDNVRDAFGLTVKTASGPVTVEEMDYNWIDSNNDVLQITIDFAPTSEVRTHLSDSPLIEVLDTDVVVNYTPTDFDRVIKAIRDGILRFHITESGHLKLFSSETANEYVMFDIRNAGHLEESVYEELNRRLRFYIDDSGTIKAEFTDTLGNKELFNIYVE